MMGWYNDGWHAGNWVVMSVMMLFWVALVGVAIWAAVKFLGGRTSTTPSAPVTPTPRAILDRRLASGEIDAEQYAQLRRLLGGQTADSGSHDTPASP